MTTTQSEQHGGSRRIRLTVEISPDLRRRIHAAAVRRDLSLRAYVERILEEVVPENENGASVRPARMRMTREDAQRLREFQEAFMRAHPGVVLSDSTDDIRKMREERDEYLDTL